MGVPSVTPTIQPSQGVPQVPPRIIKTLLGYPPPSRPGWGTPHHQDLAGAPPPTIKTWLGYPQDLAGVPPHPRPEMGYPPLPRPEMGYTPYREHTTDATNFFIGCTNKRYGRGEALGLRWGGGTLEPIYIQQQQLVCGITVTLLQNWSQSDSQATAKLVAVAVAVANAQCNSTTPKQ